jgi:hypothetical protein
VEKVIFGEEGSIVVHQARFAVRGAMLAVSFVSIAAGLGLASTTASAATGSDMAPALTPISSPPLEAAANPFGLPRVISFKVKPATGVTITIGCTGTSTQPCTGTIFAGTAETLQGKRVIAVTSSTKRTAKGKQRTIRIAQAPFSIAGGQTATIQLKLNTTGLKLLRRFHAFTAYVLAGEIIPQGKFVFLAHEVLFKTPVAKRK